MFLCVMLQINDLVLVISKFSFTVICESKFACSQHFVINLIYCTLLPVCEVQYSIILFNPLHPQGTWGNYQVFPPLSVFRCCFLPRSAQVLPIFFNSVSCPLLHVFYGLQSAVLYVSQISLKLIYIKHCNLTLFIF